LGLVEIHAMKRAGYGSRFAAAITAVSSTIGSILPPSIPFVIYGSLAQVSIGTLFLAGIVPGLLMGLALMAVVSLVARKRQLPLSNQRPPVRDAARIIGCAEPALLMPFIIIGGILGGFATPTEAAVVASIYALLIGTLFYRDLRWAPAACATSSSTVCRPCARERRPASARAPCCATTPEGTAWASG
jgi:tripartite ATP-independent transporter DctM subunit